jgi:DNA modification methylase
VIRTQVGPNVVQQADSRLPSSYRAVLGTAVGDPPHTRPTLLHADPPYCLLVRRNKRGQKRSPKKAKVSHEAVTRFEDVRSYRRFTEAWLPHALASLDPAGTALVWTNLLGRESIVGVASETGWHHADTVLWAKLGKQHNAGERLARLYEVALVFVGTPRPSLAPDEQSPPRHLISGYDDDGEAGDWEHHPNHKPFCVLEPLIRYHSRPGDRVLEPFSGSGSTAAACVRLARRVSALELRERWAAVGGRRLEAVSGG